MFITVVTHDGATARVNLAFVTHITQFESHYAEGDSIIHFSSDRSLQVKEDIATLSEHLAKIPDQ